jgi:hypothetical protein
LVKISAVTFVYHYWTQMRGQGLSAQAQNHLFLLKSNQCFYNSSLPIALSKGPMS